MSDPLEADAISIPHANQVVVPDRFTQVIRLGDGAEGGAWAAVDREGGDRVVLKRIEPERRPVVAHALAVLERLASPHLPTAKALLDTGDGAAWLVTNWVEGSPLQAGPAPVEVVVGQGRALAHALAAIHRAGSHHGDVSPANVVVTPTGGVVLVDLGQLDQLGTGTPGFLAPEVLAGSGGPAADRFALGCLLCWRLTGQVPWRRPEQLVAVRERADVERRLEELAPELPLRLRRVLLALLDPRPEGRQPSGAALVDAFSRVEAEGGASPKSMPGTTRWWSASRWPYQGEPLEPWVQRLAQPDRPALIVVAGPPGSGRRRWIQEVVLRLQSAGVAASLDRPPDGWIASWVEEASSRDGPPITGYESSLPWPGELAEQGDPGVHATRAAVLARSARAWTGCRIVMVEPETARALRHRETEGIEVVCLRPWTEHQVASALENVLDSPDRAGWARVLVEATGGWSGRLVRAAMGCAARALEHPDRTELEAVLAQADSDPEQDENMAPALARRILRSAWRPGLAHAGVPRHWLTDGRPLAAAVARARATLGAHVRAWARTQIEQLGPKEPVSLLLAIDADDETRIAHLLEGVEVLEAEDSEAAAFVHWLETGGLHRVEIGVALVGARRLLGEGRAAEALELVERVGMAARERGVASLHSAALELERGRALQRLGRAQEALEAVAGGASDGAAQPRHAIGWRRLGLRWRLLCDLGRAETAHAEATSVFSEDIDAGSDALAPATAACWAAYAALVLGELAVAEARLDSASSWTGTRAGAEAEAVVARVAQLRGTLAHVQGELERASSDYARAAAAFGRAGEAVGALMVRGSAVALALPTARVSQGARDGAAVVQGLLARGSLTALPEAVLNLVQFCLRRGDLDAAADWVHFVVEHLPRTVTATAAVQGRVARAVAEVVAARRGSHETVEQAFVRAAELLERAGLEREASDARRRAAVEARLAGRSSQALAHLSSARRLASVGGDASARAWVECEAAMLAAERARSFGDDEAPHRAASVLASSFEDLRQRGNLELELARERARFALAGTRFGSGHPVRRRLARRFFLTLEQIMKHNDPEDLEALKSSYASESSNADFLRALLGDLEAGQGTEARSDAVAASDATLVRPPETGSDEGRKLGRLIRMYRRLAREELLEPLLEQVLDAVMELTDAERGVVVVRHDARTLEVTRALAEGTDAVVFSRSVVERVLQTGEPVLSVDAAADERFDGSRSISHLNLRSVLAVPLRFRGTCMGAVYVDHRLRRGNFEDADLTLVEEFAELAALAVAHASALTAVREQAQTLERQRAELAELLDAREVEVAGLKERVRQVDPDEGERHGIVGRTPEMRRVFRLIDRLGDSDVPVVIQGESGTGKELVARAIHRAGHRGSGPFVAENCGAIPETLLESVLFGHARGAFTGAATAKPGLFEAAAGGTIFLDEVSEMSPAMQTKLLRVLQEGEVRRVGENEHRPIDVRVITASNRDLEAMVAEGTFRQDLFYRINVVRIALPPLRERADDIPELIESFVTRYRGSGGLKVTAGALRALTGHAWPGNVRELENEIQRWIALCDDVVTVDDLSPAIRGDGADVLDPDDLRIRPRVDRMERELIARALERTDGNQTKAAALLGLSRYGLQKKLRRLEEEEGASS